MGVKLETYKNGYHIGTAMTTTRPQRSAMPDIGVKTRFSAGLFRGQISKHAQAQERDEDPCEHLRWQDDCACTDHVCMQQEHMAQC